jgi:1-acyl-sn-glycerol-3-phosphate acyltransferase
MMLARSLVFYFLLALTTLVMGLAVILTEWWLPSGWRGRLSNQWGRINLWLLWQVCGLGYRVRGLENLPSGGAVVASNHQSAWETLALRALLPPRQTWVLKKELLMIPVFGWSLWVSRAIAIDRNAGTKALREVIRLGAKRLKEGRLLIIFPEGTRVEPGKHGKYGNSAGLLAARTGFPLIPVAHNAGVFWHRRGLEKHPGTIEVVMGPPIETSGLKPAEITQRLEDWIRRETERMPQSLKEL